MIPPILCYHKIDTRFELGVTRLGPRTFRRQVKALAKVGCETLGAQALLACCHAERDPWQAMLYPPRVVFTFDDGYEALAEHAFPTLADHEFRAIVFVITDYVGGANRWDVKYGWRAFQHLSWDQLGTWQERGIEVHAHGASHRRLTWLTDTEAADELGRARDEIARRLGRAPEGICYPFGAVDARIRRLAEQAGYTLGFAGPRAAGTDPLVLGRRPVYAWDVFAPPLVMRAGAIGDLARGVARLASRAAVVTSAIKGIGTPERNREAARPDRSV